MPATDIRKNDEVQVIAGKDRGRRGRVVNVVPSRNRVMVEGVARAKLAIVWRRGAAAADRPSTEPELDEVFL